MPLNVSASSVAADPRPVRRHPRTVFSVPILLRHLVAGRISVTRGMTVDLSAGGLGAIVQGELRPGETVEIDLRLADLPLSTVGIVRYSSSLRSGFEFLGLTDAERVQIEGVAGNC